MNRRMLMRGGLARYATGGKTGNQPWESPQSQKGPTQAVVDPRGTPLSQAWYENYGSGPEYMFLGDRALPKVGPFAQQSSQNPGQQGTQSSTLGDYIPLLGMGAVVGKDLYDWYKNRPGATIDPELAKRIESGAMDTTATNQWIMNDLTSRGERMPMPFMYEDGTVGYLGGDDDFWGRMDSGARDTTNIDAWNQQQLDDYGKNMEMPTVQYDPSLWQRFGQGVGGAFDIYGGAQQGGIEGAANMISGAGNLYGSVAGPNAYSGAMGRVGGGIAGLADVYNGIDRGGVEGYTQAASGAAQAARAAGYGSSGAVGALGTAATVAGAAIAAYGAYESAKVGDKKGAVAQGAAAGAAIGSVVPVIGTAVGAVIGAAVGLVGASLGNKDMPSELYYGAYKKTDPNSSLRGWSEDEINGAVYEAIKSHTKSGNINKFRDVSEMYTTFGITKDAQKNYRNVQTQMGDFIKGTIQTAIAMGALPSDPAELRHLDGQKFFYDVVTPALAAKFKEVTGQESQGWTKDYSGGESTLHNLFADLTDYTFANWGKTKTTQPTVNIPSVLGPKGSRILERSHGGLATFNEGGMVPRRGGLSMAMQPTPPSGSQSYYRYGVNSPPSVPMRQTAMPPDIMAKAMGGLAMYGFSSGGPQRLVRGPGTGRSDDIPAVLSDGEYVMDAETVALLGDGSTDEGARRLDELRKKLRMHKGKQLARGSFSSAAKNPEEYL